MNILLAPESNRSQKTQASRIWNFERLEKSDLFAASSVNDYAAPKSSRRQELEPIDAAQKGIEVLQQIDEIGLGPDASFLDLQLFFANADRETFQATKQRCAEQRTHRFNTDEIFGDWPSGIAQTKVSS